MRKRLLHILLFLLAFVCVDRLIGWGLNVGLNRYFGLTQHSEVLFVGHSHLMLAVDKEGFEQGTATEVSKYCREGVNVADRLEMVRQFLASPYSDSLKVVIYGVDQFMFTGEGLSMNSYKLFYPSWTSHTLTTISDGRQTYTITSPTSPSALFATQMLSSTVPYADGQEIGRTTRLGN